MFDNICMETLSPFVKQYLITALWSSNDESTPDGGEPFDRNFSLEDFAPAAIARAKKDCQEFLAKTYNIISDFDMTDVAHDFWLTRNHHGAGFWDGDYPKKEGRLLTELCHKFNEVYLYLGDDNKIHMG